MSNLKIVFLTFFVGLACSAFGEFAAESVAPRKEPTSSHVFSHASGRDLALDLYLPEHVLEPPPVVIYIHGGGWVEGNYRRVPLLFLLNEGFAVASIQYRFSQEAIFPAQIEDARAAVRWLRQHAQEIGIDSSRIGAVGTSAGGTLALLLGAGTDLENNPLPEEERVQAVVSYFGATDFLLRSVTQPSATDEPDGTVYRLLGGPVREKKELARQASPAWQMNESSPPLLLMHGLRDTVVLPDQARRMQEAATELGLDVALHLFPEAAHTPDDFFIPAKNPILVTFLQRHLGAAKSIRPKVEALRPP